MYRTKIITLIARDYTHELTVYHLGKEVPNKIYRWRKNELAITTRKIPFNFTDFFRCLSRTIFIDYKPICIK